MGRKVVFVHGFMGGKKTWGKFPELLRNSIDCEVAEYGFDTFYWPVFGKSTTLHNLAEGLLSEIGIRCNLESDELVLVGHSLGGLVIRQMLLNLEMKRQKHNIKKLAFFAVPQDGTGFARVAQYLPMRSYKLRAMCNEGGIIESLGDQWSYADLDLKYEILSVVGGKDAVVTSNSSKSMFRKQQVQTNIDADHRSIVKPKDDKDSSFLFLKRFIESLRTIDKYSSRASMSYEVWLRHDSRKHSSDYVSDEKRDTALRSLEEGLRGDKRLVRVSGLSGLGKSRLVLEYIKASGEIDESNVLIFSGASYRDEMKSCIYNALKDKAVGFLVVDHCPVEIHNYISREMDAMPSELRVVTLGFEHDVVESSYHVQLEAMSAEPVQQMVARIAPGLDARDIERIASFVEGYPLLAILIAERFRDDGELKGQISDQDFVDRLVNIDGPLPAEKWNILKLCSLFDVFGVQGSRSEDAEFIYGMAEARRVDFDQLITSFVDRQIINQVGDFARIVPKPLAMFLAIQWWNESLDDTKKKLLYDMPETLTASFCNQVKYLDSSTKVKDFVEGVCSRFSPFGQAELLLSKRGSRLFRGLVEVNPRATSSAIYRVIDEIGDEGIGAIDGDSRRELVWSLEMLSWHRSHFEKSSWCLLKLACFEKESYSNNSTGQFAQLFRWRNSGTEADFEQRISVLRKALALNEEKADLVVIEAVREAMSTSGSSRTVGSEQQGTKQELQEWMPEKWSEVFDYWNHLIDMLIALSEKPYSMDLVRNTIGHEIRGMVGPGTIDMLDNAIRCIVGSCGKYWPSASQSIQKSLTYDSESMQEEVKAALLQWQELLAPAEGDLEEQLILTVLDPSRDYERDEEGELVDVAANEAIELAKKLSGSEDLIPYLRLILNFEQQKKSWVFGREVIRDSSTAGRCQFFTELLDLIAKEDGAAFDFVAGCLVGLYEQDSQAWFNMIGRFARESELKPFYHYALRTGQFDLDSLMVVVELVKGGYLVSDQVAIFGHGRVLDHLTEEELARFCYALYEIDDQAKWVALDILTMYMFGRDNYDFEKLLPLLRELLLSVTFSKENKVRNHDGYHWLRLVEKILERRDVDFALALVEYLLDQFVNNDISISDLWDNFHPALCRAFELSAEKIWPAFSKRLLLLSESIPIYRLSELLVGGKGRRQKTNSVFALVSEREVVEWCKNEAALLIVAKSVSLIEQSGEERRPSRLLMNLIDSFGDNPNFQSEIRAAYHSRSWSGSLVPYLVADKAVIQSLDGDQSLRVREWAKEFVSMIDGEIVDNEKRDSEDSFVQGW